ncbi:MAG: glycosyltransferase family 2 protein [Acidobacteria bacterium]|nr:glycosyltransferase family 2 protein [Acidobacteriota bacterium]
MKGPLISCIIPVFNGEKYLGEAIESILAQSYRHVEIVVVDDGSTDRSREVAGSFGPPVRSLHQENAGPAAAKNTGIEGSRGDYLAFLDADDLWAPEKLEVQLGRFQARPDLHISVSFVRNFWEAELAGEEERFRDHRIARPLPGYSAGTLLAPRAVFDRIGLFDRNLKHADAVEWFARARSAGLTMEMLPQALLRRRLHPNNRSRMMQDGSREEFLDLVKKAIEDKRRGKESKAE